jgi:hypothetical protein
MFLDQKMNIYTLLVFLSVFFWSNEAFRTIDRELENNYYIKTNNNKDLNLLVEFPGSSY